MPDGTVLLQAITIDETRFEKYRQQAARAGLALTVHEAFGLSYARTLAIWRQRFLRARPQVKRLGFDDRFKRMWEYYLCIEAGFRNGAIDGGFSSSNLLALNQRAAICSNETHDNKIAGA